MQSPTGNSQSSHPLAVAARAFADFSPVIESQLLDIPIFSGVSEAVYLLRADRIAIQGSDTVGPGCLIAGNKIAGNKFFKLLPNIQWAREQGYTAIASFGGNWSNHLYALAAAGQHFNLQTVAAVRGERTPFLTPTLLDAQKAGMRLQFVPRGQYRQQVRALHALERHQRQLAVDQIAQQFGKCWVVPPGGSNPLGVAGAYYLGRLLATALPAGVGELLLACGTGGTLAGVVAGLDSVPGAQQGVSKPARVSGINVLRNPALEAETRQLLAGISSKTGTVSQHWRVLNRYHGGGYARVNKELEVFLHQLEQQLGEPVDHVYMAKVLYAAWHLLKAGTPGKGPIAILHTGGQQGRRGL